MQANQSGVVWCIVISTILILLGLFIVTTQIPEAPVIPEYPVYDIPTAQEVADLIVLPDVPLTRFSLRQELKEEAIDTCDSEFDMDDVEDLFGNDDEVELISEYTDDRDYYNINVGIDDSDDRKVNVDRVYKVQVEPDLDDDYKDKVYVTCEVTSEDGELEADITYTL